MGLLLYKDVSEMLASRVFWLLMLAIGPLVGHAFITAVDSYAEASGASGGPAALSQGLSPLDGMLVPTFGAYDLIVTLLFPFLVIRLISTEKTTDALKLVLQWPVSMGEVIASKVVALLAAWCVALLAGAVAMFLWHGYGGHLWPAESWNVLLAYLLKALLTISISAAAAAIMPGAANAAILVLAFTIGTWALDFIAAGRGGWLQTIASFTPTAALRSFEQGLFRWNIVLVVCIVSALCLGIAAFWLQTRFGLGQRAVRAAMAMGIAGVLLFGAVHVRGSVDLSEDRRNSFPAADEAALRNIHQPLNIRIYLAAEDPRLNDFERNILLKLKRTLPEVRVEYPLAGRSGLFESNSHYGEIEYSSGGRSEVSRSTTEPIVMESIYKVFGVAPPQSEEGAQYSGYPLKARPAGAAVCFYLLWPAAVLAAWIAHIKFVR